MTVTRFGRFRSHMALHRLKWKDVSSIIGIGVNNCCIICQKEQMKLEYYNKLLQFGFPKESLPEPREESVSLMADIMEDISDNL